MLSVTTNYGLYTPLLLLALFLSHAPAGWGFAPVYQPRQRAVTLRYADDSDNLDAALQQRVQFAGVSVSSTGFWAILRVAADSFLPIRVTDDIADTSAATSAEALTMLQLLADVDMAGAILPPDILSKAVVLSCEETEERSEVANDVLERVYRKLPEGAQSYGEMQSWWQSRVPLPLATMDEVLMDDANTFTWQCSVRHMGPIAVSATESVVQPVTYQYRPKVSSSFMSLALALRYKAPISIRVQGLQESFLTEEALMKRFPMYRGMDKLQQSSQRAATAVERGFEINKLQAALRIAMEKGDQSAAEKIRAVLDEMDSMNDLPVQPDSDMSDMQ